MAARCRNATGGDHDHNLEQCLKRCRENGIKLNPDKTEIGLTEVQYFGHILSADGLKPDPYKVAAIRDMKPPENRSELETILGMITYLSKFAPICGNDKPATTTSDEGR